MSIRTAWPLLLAVLAACHPRPHAAQAPAAEPARHPAVSRTVPADPPRGVNPAVAAEIYAPDNVVPGAPQMTGPYPRDVVWVIFRDASSQADRQAAVDLVGGEVIGGAPIRRGGIYYVRIRHDGTAGPLFAAIDRLKALPQVALATPDLSLTSNP